jgi:hypothetical protein
MRSAALGLIMTASFSCTSPPKSEPPPASEPIDWHHRANHLLEIRKTREISRVDVEAQLPPAPESPVRIRSQEDGYILVYELDEVWRAAVGYSRAPEIRTNASPDFAGGEPEDRFIGPLEIYQNGDYETRIPLVPAP